MKVLKIKYGKEEISNNILIVFYGTNIQKNGKIGYRFLYENLIGFSCQFPVGGYIIAGTFIIFCHYHNLVYGRNYKLYDKIKKRKKNT